MPKQNRIGAENVGIRSGRDYCFLRACVRHSMMKGCATTMINRPILWTLSTLELTWDATRTLNHSLRQHYVGNHPHTHQLVAAKLSCVQENFRQKQLLEFIKLVSPGFAPRQRTCELKHKNSGFVTASSWRARSTPHSGCD